MKFHIKKIILWLKNGKIRILKFKPNKVNIITGDSNTGKTAILEIIDYCFFASSSRISESIINENISWYGMSFVINDQQYTLARKSLNKGVVSKEYYLSSTGEVPGELDFNNSEKNIKSILETEFNIDSNVSIPYGSNSLRAGSKISLRYFLMFNTISGNIIENNTGIFFDKQNESRYRDALPRIFDIALGVETIENVLKKEKKVELEKKLNSLYRKIKLILQKSNEFKDEKASIVKLAKEYSLIDSNLELEPGIEALNEILTGIELSSSNSNEREQLENDFYRSEEHV